MIPFLSFKLCLDNISLQDLAAQRRLHQDLGQDHRQQGDVPRMPLVAPRATASFTLKLRSPDRTERTKASTSSPLNTASPTRKQWTSWTSRKQWTSWTSRKQWTGWTSAEAEAEAANHSRQHLSGRYANRDSKKVQSYADIILLVIPRPSWNTK